MHVRRARWRVRWVHGANMSVPEVEFRMGILCKVKLSGLLVNKRPLVSQACYAYAHMDTYV